MILPGTELRLAEKGVRVRQLQEGGGGLKRLFCAWHRWACRAPEALGVPAEWGWVAQSPRCPGTRGQGGQTGWRMGMQEHTWVAMSGSAPVFHHLGASSAEVLSAWMRDLGLLGVQRGIRSPAHGLIPRGD